MTHNQIYHIISQSRDILNFHTKIDQNDTNRICNIIQNNTFYTISTPDIGQKITKLTHSQIMTIIKFLVLATQKKIFLPVTYIRSFRGPVPTSGEITNKNNVIKAQ